MFDHKHWNRTKRVLAAMTGRRPYPKPLSLGDIGLTLGYPRRPAEPMPDPNYPPWVMAAPGLTPTTTTQTLEPSPMSPTFTAYEMGARAYRAGVSTHAVNGELSSNPFLPHTENFRRWRCGWEAARNLDPKVMHTTERPVPADTQSPPPPNAAPTPPPAGKIVAGAERGSAQDIGQRIISGILVHGFENDEDAERVLLGQLPRVIEVIETALSENAKAIAPSILQLQPMWNVEMIRRISDLEKRLDAAVRRIKPD